MAASSSLHLSDLGIEEAPVPIQMPREVDSNDLAKGHEILRYVQPESESYDTLLHIHSCTLESSTGARDAYDVRISYSTDVKSWCIWSCTCPQATNFDAPCKHVVAFFLHLIEKQNPHSAAKKRQSAAITTRGGASATSNLTTSITAASSSSHRPSTAAAAASKAPASPQRKTTLPHAAAVSARMTSPRKPIDSALPNHAIAASTSTTKNLIVPPAHANAGSPAAANSSSLNSPPIHPPSSSSASDAGSAVPSGISSAISPSVLHHGKPRKQDMWRCSMCAQRNPTSATRCKECQAIRKFDSVVIQPPAPNTWRCTFCAYDNKYSESPEKCKICGGIHSAPQSNSNPHAAVVAPAMNSLGSGGSGSGGGVPPLSLNSSSAVHAPAATAIGSGVGGAISPSLSLSLSLDSVPAFAATEAPTPTAAASSTILPPLRKKAMSMIAETAREDTASEAQGDEDAEKQKRWQALLNEPTSTTPAAAPIAHTKRSSRSSAAAASASSSKPSTSAAAADLASSRPLVINFTNGRGEGRRKKAPIVIDKEKDRERVKKEQEENDAELAKKMQQEEEEKKEKDGAPDDGEGKAKISLRGRNPAKPRAKVMPKATTTKAKPKSRKRSRLGTSDSEYDDADSEYEEEKEEQVRKEEKVEEEKVEEKHRPDEEKKVDADGDTEMADAPHPAAAAAAAAAPSTAAPSGAPPTGGRAMPSFIVHPPTASKRATKASIAAAAAASATNDGNADHAVVAPAKKPRVKKEPSEKKPRVKKEPTARKPRAAAASTGTRKRVTRARDDDSVENSEDDGDADLYDAIDEEGVPELISPSAAPEYDEVTARRKAALAQGIPAELLQVIQGESLDPQDIMDMATHYHNQANPGAKEANGHESGSKAKPYQLCESTLAETLQTSRALLDSLTSRGGAAVPSPDVDVKPRKKRRITLKDLISDAPKLYELIQQPPTQSQDVIPMPQEQEHDVVIKRDQDEAMDEDEQAMADMLGEEKNPAAAPPVRRPSRQSSRLSVRHDSTASSTKYTSATNVATRTPSNTDANPSAAAASSTKSAGRAAGIDSEDDLEANLEGMLFNDAPAPVPIETFKFKAERDAEEAMKMQLEEQKKMEEERQQRRMSLDIDEGMDDLDADEDAVNRETASELPLEHDEDDAAAALSDPESIDHKPTEWKKVQRLTSAERKALQQAKAKAQKKPRKSAVPKAKPAATAASKKKTTKRTASQKADDSDAEPAVASSRAKSRLPPSSSHIDHPLSRLEAATSSILTLFPDLTLDEAARFLMHFEDDAERTVDWLLKHTSEEERRAVLDGEVDAAAFASEVKARARRTRNADDDGEEEMKRSSNTARAERSRDERDDAHHADETKESVEPPTATQAALEDAMDDLLFTPDEAASSSRPTRSQSRRAATTLLAASSAAVASSGTQPKFHIKSEDSADETFNPMDELFPMDDAPKRETVDTAAPSNHARASNSTNSHSPLTTTRKTRSSRAPISAASSADDIAAYYQSDAFDAKVMSEARTKERQRRSRGTTQQQQYTELTTVTEDDRPKPEVQDDGDDLIERKYADEDDNAAAAAAPPLSPRSTLYHFPSNATAPPVNDEDQAPSSAVKPPAWSRRKAPVVDQTDDPPPLPAIIRERKLRAQIAQLEQKKREAIARGDFGAIPPVARRSVVKPGRLPQPRRNTEAPAAEATVEVDLNAPRGSRSATAAEKNANSEAKSAAEELREHRKRLAAAGGVTVKQEPGLEPESADQSTQRNQHAAASSSAAPTSVRTHHFETEEEEEETVVRQPRRSDVEVRSRRRKQ